MRINESDCLALVIDVQERLVPAMHQPEVLLASTVRLLEGYRILGLPLVVSEQYPKGLGSTVPALADLLKAAAILPKLSFSCLDDPAIAEKLASFGRKTIVVSGIESHVCVLQTVVDLLAAGYQVVVLADCVASRQTTERDIALARMAREGAIISTSESILFELCRVTGTERFKAISRLVK